MIFIKRGDALFNFVSAVYVHHVLMMHLASPRTNLNWSGVKFYRLILISEVRMTIWCKSKNCTLNMCLYAEPEIKLNIFALNGS